jgi:hypothetical protein
MNNLPFIVLTYDYKGYRGCHHHRMIVGFTTTVCECQEDFFQHTSAALNYVIVYMYMYLVMVFNATFNNISAKSYISPLKLWVRVLLRRGVHDTTVYDKVCQRLATGLWISLGTLVSSTNKTDCHDIAEILLKVAM